MNKSLKKTTLLLFILRLLRMVITIITTTFSAKYFGVSMEKDIWILTLTIIAIVTGAVWGPINEIFRAKFVFIKEKEGANAALHKTASLIKFIFVVTILIAFSLFLAAPYISESMTYNMQMGAAALFVSLLLLQLPSLLINELTNIGISILNAYDVYYLPEIVGFVSGLVNLASIILLASSIGIYSLLIGMYLGIIVLFVVVGVFLHKKDLAIWRKSYSFNWKDVKIFLIFALPFFFPYFIGQINTLFEKYLAGMLGSGNISSVEYARQFVSVLQNVLSSVLATIMVPILAKQFVNRMKNDFTRTILDNLMVCMLIYGAASVFLIGSSTPLCDFFFNRGKVSTEDLIVIVELTRLYGMAFLGVLMYLVMGMSLLASNMGKAYASVGVCTQIAVLATNLLLCPYWGVFIFPVALGGMHFIAGITMFLLIKFINHRSISIYLLRAILTISVLSILILFFNEFVEYEISSVRLIIVGVIFILLLPVIAWLLGFHVKTMALKLMFNKKNEKACSIF